jgi:hypothetical protein
MRTSDRKTVECASPALDPHHTPSIFQNAQTGAKARARELNM